MKTQINTLVSGNQFLVGTSLEIRNQISEKVKSENQESMTILFRGHELKLTANWSLSRKSVCWAGNFPVSLYRELFGNYGIPADHNSPEATIIINQNMTVNVQTNSKFRNSGKKGWQVISESEITIL